MNQEQIKMLRRLIQDEIECAGINGMEHVAWGWAEKQLDKGWAEFQESFHDNGPCTNGLKHFPDADADLIDSGSKVG